MDFLKLIKPLNESHSIKEAVITLFLPNKIIRPERFQKMISTEFDGVFQQFQPLQRVQVQIKNEKGVSSVDTNTLENVGFRFLAFDKDGKAIKVFQGINEEGRQFLSYHSLQYPRWDTFVSEFNDVISRFIQEPKDMFFEAFSLNYIDVFTWLGNPDEFQSEILFRKNSSTLPERFFDSRFNRTLLITTENEYEGLIFSERVEIRAEKKILPEILINHNVIHKLPETDSLENIKNDSTFAQKLNIAHKRNKETLTTILTADVQKLIHLK